MWQVLPDLAAWFANYLVVRRAAQKANTSPPQNAAGAARLRRLVCQLPGGAARCARGQLPRTLPVHGRQARRPRPAAFTRAHHT
eukprot:355855-Chlamydomonas_euryale.AAC.1